MLELKLKPHICIAAHMCTNSENATHRAYFISVFNCNCTFIMHALPQQSLIPPKLFNFVVDSLGHITAS